MPNWDPVFSNEDKQPVGTVKAKWCAYCITTYEQPPTQYATDVGIKGVSAVYVNKDTLEVWTDYMLSRPDFDGQPSRSAIVGPYVAPAEENVAEASVVEARLKQAFIDKALSARATLAIKIVRDRQLLTPYYASNYFWRKFSKTINETLTALRELRTRKNQWSVTLEYNAGVSRLVAAEGLNTPDLEKIKTVLDDALVEATGGHKGRGRPRTRVRDEQDKPQRKKYPPKPGIAKKKPAVKPKPPLAPTSKPSSTIVKPKPVVNKPAVPSKPKDHDEDLDSYVEMIDGPRLVAPQPPANTQISTLELERTIRKQFERSASELPASAWEIIKRNYGTRMSDEFKEKYRKQLEPDLVTGSALHRIARALNRSK